MQKIFLCDISIKSYKMLNIAMSEIIQNNFTEISAIKDCNLCVLLWATQEANVPKYLFHFTFSLKKIFVMIVFCMMNIQEKYIKK